MLRVAAFTVIALVLAIGVAACGDAGDGGTATPAATPAETIPAATPSTTATAPAGGAADGASLFAENCSACHKANGSGGSGPDLRGEDNAGRVAEQIRQGGDRMPSFSADLTDEQIQAIAAHVVDGL